MVPDLAGLRDHDPPGSSLTQHSTACVSTSGRNTREYGESSGVLSEFSPIACGPLRLSRIIAVPRSDELAEAMMEPLPPGPGVAVLVIPIAALSPPVRGLGLVSATPTPSGCPAR